MLYYELNLRCVMKVSKKVAKLLKKDNKDKTLLINSFVQELNVNLQKSRKSFSLEHFGARDCEIIGLNEKRELEFSFSVIAAQQSYKPFDEAAKENLAKKVSEVFPVYKLGINIEETTPENILQQVKDNKTKTGEKFVDSLKIPEFTYGEFDYSENFIENADLTLEDALKTAEEIMADEDFKEEIRRIYSDANAKEFFAHPVHYYLKARDKVSVYPMVKLLLQSLLTNKRIPSMRVDLFTNLDTYIDDLENFHNFFWMAEGASVVIDAFTKDSMRRSDNENVVNTLCNNMKHMSMNTLFIVVDVEGESCFGTKLVDNLQSNMHFMKLGSAEKISEPLEKMLERMADKYGLSQTFQNTPPLIVNRRPTYTYDEAMEIFNNWAKAMACRKYYIAYSDVKVEVKNKDINPKTDSMDNLEQLVGLKSAKEVAKELIATARVNKTRKDKGLLVENSALHMIFTGNPGSAKTTFARLIAQILAEYGVTRKANIVECGRVDLVGKYVGWTANCVKDKFKEAAGGVLFIDEAYSLCGEGKDFGAEAINTIVQEMENHRDDVVVIFAGYPEKMKEFLKQNEGLRSRIPYHMEFPDYSEDELMCIFKKMAEARQYEYSTGFEKKCREKIKEALKTKDFGNGRFVRNILERAIAKQAVRLTDEYDLDNIKTEDLRHLKTEDFPNVLGKLDDKVHGSIPLGIAL